MAVMKNKKLIFILAILTKFLYGFMGEVGYSAIKEQKDGLEEKTQSKNILKVLNKLIDNSYNIYVMTNETDLTLFDDIKNKYNTYFYTDFKELCKSI